MKSSAAEEQLYFVNALRDMLGLSPLNGEGKRATELERFYMPQSDGRSGWKKATRERST